MKASKKTVSPVDVPSYQRFVAAQQKLHEFMSGHEDVFNRYIALIEEYNTALEAAGGELYNLSVESGQGCSIGPFQFKHFVQKFDAQALFQRVDAETYEKLGGRKSTKVVYEVDKKLIELAIARNEIPKDLLEAFAKTSPVYDKPKPISAP